MWVLWRLEVWAIPADYIYEFTGRIYGKATICRLSHAVAICLLHLISPRFCHSVSLYVQHSAFRRTTYRILALQIKARTRGSFHHTSGRLRLANESQSHPRSLQDSNLRRLTQQIRPLAGYWYIVNLHTTLWETVYGLTEDEWLITMVRLSPFDKRDWCMR